MMTDVSWIRTDQGMTHIDPMTHAKFQVMSGKRVICVMPLTNSKICVINSMTHDTYDTWFVPTTRARKGTNTNICHMCHMCHGVRQ